EKLHFLGILIMCENNRVHAHVNGTGGAVATRVREFFNMNRHEFLESHTNEYPQNFLDEIKKIFEVMQVTGNDRLREARAQEFMNLRKGKMTVQEYGLKFKRISRWWKSLAWKAKVFGSIPLISSCPILQEQSSHRLRDCPSRKGQGGGNGRAQSTTSAALASHQTHHGYSSSTGGGQRQNKLYTLQDRQDQEGSPDLVIGTLCVFDLDVYALVDPKSPSRKKINFGIDVIRDTHPISIPHYRMAPAELKELKEQLKDLIDKGFIRPSISPWDTPVLFMCSLTKKPSVCVHPKGVESLPGRWIEFLTDYYMSVH
ncbi:hypothetical protein EJD97_002705, partial [Solanum chilense]